MSGYGRNETTRRITRRLDDRLRIPDESPEIRLIIALLVRAAVDYMNGSSSAAVFIQSPDFDDWCDWGGIDPASLRDRLENKRHYRRSVKAADM